MKQFFIILGVLLLASTSFGAITVTDSSDAFVGNFHRVKCGADLSCTKDDGNRLLVDLSAAVTMTAVTVSGQATLSGDVVGDGGDQLYGFLQNQVASTTVALTAAQCGSTIVGAGAHTLTLPEASTVLGCRYTFVGGTADDLAINPADGTDTIGPINFSSGGTSAAIAPSAGDAIQMTDIGSSLILEAVGADLWSVIGMANGTIADIN